MKKEFLQAFKIGDQPLTEDNVLSVIDGYLTAMKEANVPGAGKWLYVTPHVEELIKNAKQVNMMLAHPKSVIGYLS